MQSLSKRFRDTPTRIIVDYIPSCRRSILLAGTVRSGTTWTSNVINYRNEYRYMFEPFHPDVERCRIFRPRQYLTPENRDAALLAQARAVFSGRIRHARVDQFNKRVFASKQLIKVIHANLMLSWVHAHFPAMPIVLLVRHPCAVASSLLKLGWDPALKYLLCQETLLNGELRPWRKQIEAARGVFEEHVFLWCIETYVALKKVRRGEVHLAFYENLCQHPEEQIAQMFGFLAKPYDDRVLASVRQPSPLSRADSPIITGGTLVGSWRASISAPLLRQAMETAGLFGLDRIYGSDPLPDAEAAFTMMGS